MFKDFSRSGHAQVSSAINAALVEVGEKLGLTFEVGGGSIGATTLTIKVVASSVDTTAVDDRAKLMIESYGRSFGLAGADFGRVFESGGRRFKFTGISPNRPKYPLDGECLSTGKSFKFGASTAGKIIAARPPASAAVTPLSAADQSSPFYGAF